MLCFFVLFCFLAGECSGECYEHHCADLETSAISLSNQTMTLRDALIFALLKNPELDVFSFEIRAREARILQAGLLPNPEIAVEIEDFAGSRTHTGFDTTESTIRLSQLIELGGKRKNRKSVARFDKSISRWDYDAKRLDVLSGTARAFIEVLFAQESVALAREQYRIAQEVYKTVSEKANAGKVSPLEESKAKVALATSMIELEKTERTQNSSRQKLASFWGGTEVSFNKVEGDFDSVTKVPDIEQLVKIIIRNPDLARWDDEVKFRQAMINLEKSRAIPNIIIGGGVRKYEETDDYGFVVNLSIPIPIFDRNQGSIREAKNKLAKSQKEYDTTDVRIRTDLFQVYQELSSSYTEVLSLKNDVLPSAKRAFDASSEGYKQGKFEYLDVLDAQRTFFSARAQYLSSLSRYHKSFAELERLIGGCLDAYDRLQTKEVK